MYPGSSLPDEGSERGFGDAMRQQQQPRQVWQDFPHRNQGWQGQLGPNLMPMGDPAPPPPMQPSPQTNSMQGPPMQLFPPMNMQGPPPMRPGPQMGGMPDMPPMNSMPGPPMQPGLPMQLPNMQGGPMMQMIALPPGAPPPEGAIPMGPAGGMQQPTPQQMVQPPQQMVQILVPVGETPPEGAIPMDQFSVGSVTTGASTPETFIPPSKKSSALKIKDPRTGKEVCASGDESGTSRRLRIVNPKTGKEVTA